MKLCPLPRFHFEVDWLHLDTAYQESGKSLHQRADRLCDCRFKIISVALSGQKRDCLKKIAYKIEENLYDC